MARRRGFFAEIAHQQAVAQRNHQRAQSAAMHDRVRVLREAERARQAAVRAQEQMLRANIASNRAAQVAATQAHQTARQAQVDLANADLRLRLEELDNLLAATLAVDDFVDLNQLRATAEHPRFESVHETPIPPPPLPQGSPPPVYQAPPAPKGLASVFAKKKHEQAASAAQAAFSEAVHHWNQQAAAVPGQQLALMNDHQAAEQRRLALLAEERATYDADCAERERVVDESNERLDSFIADLAAGDAHAVEEYFSIVFANTVYPDYFPGLADIRYDEQTGELELHYVYPAPSALPTERAYRYVRSSDEITSTSQPQREQKDRYNGLVAAVALRILHEAWEADRAGHVKTISFSGLTSHIDPATGNEVATTLVQLAADRSQFLELDLARVTPTETLSYLGANVSKNAYGLVPAPAGTGVRRH